MIITKFTYLSPPRPERAIPPAMLAFYEQLGWFAQLKKNGTCSVIYVSPEKEVTGYGRHGAEKHRSWSFTENSRKAFETLPGSGWYVFVAELMHSKVPGIRDTNYVHDILVSDGKYLLGTTYAQRLKIINQLLVGPDCTLEPGYWKKSDHLWIVRNFRENFAELFASLQKKDGAGKDLHPGDEGLVLKNPSGLLSVKNNGEWAVKCRKGTKLYGF